MSAPADFVRLHQAASHLHNLGPRALYEFLSEIGEQTNTIGEILALSDRWRDMNPEILQALRGDQLPRLIRAVPR